MAPLINASHLFPAATGYRALNALNADMLIEETPQPLLAAYAIREPHAEWLASLDDTDRTIWRVAFTLYNVLTYRGTCYHSTFFLYYHLKHEYGIAGGHAEVGFVSDGTPNSYGSHAWYRHQGRLTDVAISRPLDAVNNWKGPLTILDRNIVPGWKWNYHTEGSRHGLQAVKNLFTLASDDPHDVITAAKRLHVHMSNIARSDSAIRDYLDSAPRGLTYDDLAERISYLEHANVA